MTDSSSSLFVQTLPGSFGDLGPLGREQALEPGATLWREGDPGDHVVLLLEGRLEVSHQAPDGEDIILRHLYPGAVAGEMAALDGQARSATVRARSTSRVLGKANSSHGMSRSGKTRASRLSDRAWGVPSVTVAR